MNEEVIAKINKMVDELLAENPEGLAKLSLSERIEHSTSEAVNKIIRDAIHKLPEDTDIKQAYMDVKWGLLKAMYDQMIYCNVSVNPDIRAEELTRIIHKEVFVFLFVQQ